MKQNVRPLDGIRELVAIARASCGRPNHSPDVVNYMRLHFWDEIAEDGDALKELALDGLSDFVRAIIKKYKRSGDDGGSARAQQLEMFDERFRPLVIEIDREAVFVPSRDEYVELTPDGMTPREMREAGAYLVAKGRDCIARGETLMRLADAMSVE